MYALPAVLFLSYYPVITLGVSETMNLELSLPMIWLVGFDACLVVAVGLRRKWGEVFADVKRGWKWLVALAFVTLSVIWSANVMRGVLTCGVMWLVVVAIYGLWKMLAGGATSELRFKRAVFYKVLFGSSLLVCVWCVVQCVMDMWGVSSEYTLMCRGCVTQMFGFPHPNGFAIEPQFMGNLLLAPAIVAAWLWLKHERELSVRRRVLLVGCFFVVVATLFLTFSRGAIYAFIVGMLFMSGLVVAKWKMWRKVVAMWGAVILAFVVTLNFQGIMSQIGPTSDTYADGVAKVVNHLSLGVIDFRNKEVRLDPVENPVENSEEGKVEAIFDGYVEESTNIRMELTRDAITVWGWDFRTMLVGVGIGGAGQAMYDAGLIGSPKEIVQNEYASLLVETGLVGVILCGWLVVMVVKAAMKGRGAGMILAMLVAYGVSLIFFSGMANALQIYLMPAAMYAVMNMNDGAGKNALGSRKRRIFRQ